MCATAHRTAWSRHGHGHPATPVPGGDPARDFDFLFGGRAVLARFLWSDATAVSAHREQASSEGGGRTWETNWTMDLERVS